MNVNRLKYFIELCRVRSFSRAAENLTISQPGLSLQIQKLEEEFGHCLVDRNSKPLGITEEGELFLGKAIKITQLVDDLHKLSLEIDDAIAGQIRIGIIPTLSPYLIPMVMEQVSKVYPKLKVEVVELITEDILDQLNFNELDAGIISTPIQSAAVSTIPLFYEKFYLYVSENHSLYEQDRIKQQEVPNDELWYLTEGNCFQNQMNSVCPIPSFDMVNSNFRYISSSIESLKRMVEAKGGITFIPELATLNVSSEYEDLIKSFEAPEPHREISLIFLKNRGMKKLVNAFMEMVLEAIPKRMKEKPGNLPLDTKL